MILNYWYSKHPLKSISHSHNFPNKGGIMHIFSRSLWIMSEETQKKNIPNLYPKLLHPVPGILVNKSSVSNNRSSRFQSNQF